jgi:hypothetical protein
LSGLQCGSQKVAPWGSLLPVFSKSKNRLYKNIVCATLDGSSDFIYFDVFRICKRNIRHTIDLDIMLENGWAAHNTSDICRMQFKYPGDISDLKRHKCFHDPINSCPASFTIRTEKVLRTREEIVTSCDSGQQSIDIARISYANVHCFVCQKSNLQDDLTCGLDSGIRSWPSGQAVLLDTRFILDFNANDLKKKATPIACRVGNVRIDLLIV